MSYEIRKAEAERDDRYKRLEDQAQSITTRTTAWMTEATNLHTDSLDAAERTDVIALRDGLVSDLRTILGV